MNNKNLGVIAGLITIFIFFTGINSLPALLNVTTLNDSSGLIGSGINRKLSIGLLILSQATYYISFYYILVRIREKYFPDKNKLSSLLENYEYSVFRHKNFFFFIISLLFGLGISFLFMEGIWDPVPKLIDEQNYSVLLGFGMFSLAGNFITVWNAYELSSDI